MTNTSENKPKAKGPFRTGMVVPTLVLAALVYGYFFLFFDGHLRRGIEFAVTRIHGAEVNVSSVRTSFLRASFRLQGLEVTDKEHPERNLVGIGEIRFQALWDALLRGKIAIEDASVFDIRALTPRRRPGYVLPPPPPSTPGLLAEAQGQVMRQVRQQLNQNFLGDIADVASGADPRAQLKKVQDSLKAEARAKELEQELGAKKAEWEKRIAELPRPKDIQELETRIKALNLGSGNPIEIAGKLKKAKEIVAEAQAKVKQVEDTQAKLTGELGTYTKAMADLERLAHQDVADLQKRLKIPSIDPKEFSTQLFLAQVEKRVAGIRKYIVVARKYMPARSPGDGAGRKAQEEPLLPPARGEGRTYHFPVAKGYPLFWMKKAAISSELSQSDWAGKVSGEILDLTTSPAQLGRPTKMHLAGDFPKQGIRGLDFLAVVDHTGARAKETVKASVASFPVKDQVFSDSESVKLALQQASASGSLKATLADSTLDISLASRFDRPVFAFDAKSPPVRKIVGAVLKSIPAVTMSARVTGSWDRFGVSIDSNLGAELSRGFQKQLQARLGEAKAQLQKLVDDKIGPNKKRLQELLGGLSSGPGGALSGRKDEMSKALKGAQGAASGGAAPASKGRNLLKGFGF